MFSPKNILLTGTITAGLAVALGAFGAHALKPMLTENNAVDTYALAAQYQFYHALALLAIGLLANQYPLVKKWAVAAAVMFMGIVLFSGSLYLLALTGSRAVVFITPMGGVFFLTGWGILIAAILKIK